MPLLKPGDGRASQTVAFFDRDVSDEKMTLGIRMNSCPFFPALAISWIVYLGFGMVIPIQNYDGQ